MKPAKPKKEAAGQASKPKKQPAASHPRQAEEAGGRQARHKTETLASTTGSPTELRSP